ALQVKTIVMSKQQPDNNAGLVDLLQKAIAENGLDNNTHYAFMFELAQRQLIMQDYAGAQASAQRFLTETRSNKPEVLAIEGNAYYRLQKLPEAAEALRGAIANNPSADKSWTQMLVKIYYDMGKPDEAAKLAETMVATAPAAGALIDLAITYRDSKQMDKAGEVIDRARKAGQLTDLRAYQTAFGIYAKLDGHEQDVIDTVNEGLKKGVLTGNLGAYNALAEAYYYSDQIDPAVAAWNQAAPLAKDGQIYLNLAIVLNQEQRFSAAKEAATKALAKGLPAPGEAWKQIAKAEDGLGNAAAAAAARNKAGSH
ncbi:MAG TPA: tetratricopeptide repeat protein, partial [Duganella sp.]|uniref:tetratricopeptide repeat protein n=1 Tax=Duganella sp. TaxID=1904440 RepID=UPI002ED3624F